MKILTVIAILVLSVRAYAQPSAEDLYAEGQAAYDRADYTIAIAKWQAAYDLSSASGLLFNVAQAKRLSGDCVGALAAYRRFAAEDSDRGSEQHVLADDFVRELSASCRKDPDAVPKTELPRPVGGSALPRELSAHSQPQGGRRWKIAGIATGGAGIIVLGVGLGLGYHGAGLGDEITAACATSCDWEQLKSKEARGRRDVTIGRALDVVGVAAIAGGAVMYYLGTRDTVAVEPVARGSGAVISWSGSW